MKIIQIILQTYRAPLQADREGFIFEIDVPSTLNEPIRIGIDDDQIKQAQTDSYRAQVLEKNLYSYLCERLTRVILANTGPDGINLSLLQNTETKVADKRQDINAENNSKARR